MLYAIAEATFCSAVILWALPQLASHAPARGFGPRREGHSTSIADRLALSSLVAICAAIGSGAISAGIPVVEQMRASVVAREPGTVTVEVYGYKARDCARVLNLHYAKNRRGEPAKASVEWIGDRAPGSSRPTGWQSFGRWRFEWDLGEEPVTEVWSESWHDCGRLWPNVRSVAGPFKIPRP